MRQVLCPVLAGRALAAVEAAHPGLPGAWCMLAADLGVLPMALIFQATAHAIRGEQEAMGARIADAVSLAPVDQDVLGCASGHCRATFCLLAGDLDQAHAQMTAGAGRLLGSAAAIAPPLPGLWPLLRAVLDRNAAGAAARVRAARSTRHLVVAALLGYVDAILAGRQGRPVPRRWSGSWPGPGSARTRRSCSTGTGPPWVSGS